MAAHHPAPPMNMALPSKIAASLTGAPRQGATVSVGSSITLPAATALAPSATEMTCGNSVGVGLAQPAGRERLSCSRKKVGRGRVVEAAGTLRHHLLVGEMRVTQDRLAARSCFVSFSLGPSRSAPLRGS